MELDCFRCYYLFRPIGMIMGSPNRNIISMLLALFMWSQLFSLFGAFETFTATCLDDLDPEHIVTMDPFLASTSLRINNELEALHRVVVAGVAALLAMFCSLVLRFDCAAQFLQETLSGDNRLWLRRRRLLI